MSNPQEVIEDVCRFVEIEFSPSLIEQDNGRAQASSVTGEKYRGINKETSSNWQKRITRMERAFVTMLTKRSMKRFGFDPSKYS